jgi:hypothetical protein
MQNPPDNVPDSSFDSQTFTAHPLRMHKAKPPNHQKASEPSELLANEIALDFTAASSTVFAAPLPMTQGIVFGEWML